MEDIPYRSFAEYFKGLGRSPSEKNFEAFEKWQKIYFPMFEEARQTFHKLDAEEASSPLMRQAMGNFIAYLDEKNLNLRDDKDFFKKFIICLMWFFEFGYCSGKGWLPELLKAYQDYNEDTK